MNYPTPEQVDQADCVQLARWHRFLPGPGYARVGEPDFSDTCDREAAILRRVISRLADMGGFTPEISKQIEWDR